MRNIPCENIENKLVAYINDELPEIDLNYVQKHISSCEKCQKEVNELKTVLGVIDEVPTFIPLPSLKQNFEKLLEVEKDTQRHFPTTNSSYRKMRKLWNAALIQVAASVIILMIGIWMGRQMQWQPHNEEVVELKNDLQDMKQLVMLSMLEKSSASERIKAVYAVSELEEPSEQVLQVLIETLNKDHNMNVRLAAISALSRFSATANIRQEAIEALSKQNDAIVQLALINLLVSWEEKKAAEAFKDLLKKEETPEVVKEQAEIGLQMLM